eukprot:TRINITY_DN14232_c0_g1_i1.p1 TRINITY_DN14232_c0_g1~~TRINITY_DN14232_c0_g1_i1.p1  ORF type:complete len:333 (+),score=2.52 TRINITY_DN14232_c0_g1_i1:85-999(+)
MPHIPNVNEMQQSFLEAFRSKIKDLDGPTLQKLQALLPHVEIPGFPQIQAALLWYYGCIYSYASNALDQSPFSTTTPWWNEQAVLSNCTLPSAHDMLLAPVYREPITRWPFFLFLFGAMLCLLSSTTCHLLCCHSKEVSQVIWRFDYAGIAALISTSFFPPVFYSFLCQPAVQITYLVAVSVMGLLTVAVSLLPVFQTTKYRTFRASLFFGMGASGLLPCMHKLLLHYNDPLAVTTTCYELLMGALYGLGALFYATRIPERWLPGRFDIAGHSHQIFHVLVIAGAYVHYRTGLLYLQWRDTHSC